MAQEKKLMGAEIILKALQDQGVDVVFGYPGGVTLPLYEKIYGQNHLRHILVRHEQGGVHAAEGYARSTGKPGVVIVTSGPGATNTVTGLVDALMDSIPIVCITGQVFSHLIGNDAFQEADTTGITRAATKHNYLVRDVEDLARTIHEAFHVATSGKPGPVLIDIPKDVLIGHGAYMEPVKAKHKTYNPRTKGDPKMIEKAVDLLMSAKRPILYGGGGLINSGPRAGKYLQELANLTGYPFTLTLMGLGAVPASHKNYLGMPGMHGTLEANLAMHGCDVMFNVGARFDDRVTGRTDKFAPDAKKIHIDIDPACINKNVHVDVPIIGDAGSIMKEIVALWKAKKAKANQAALKKWWAQIDKWRSKNCLDFKQGPDIILPQYALSRLNEAMQGKDVYITTDVGQHQMWAAQYLRFDKPKRWMTSGGLGTMGYGVPAAMGVQLAHPNSKVVCVTSEGSIMMNIQELATISYYKLPVKILNLNNKVLGMIRQWQELFHQNLESECDLNAPPDFMKLADAFGFVALRADKPSEVDDVLAEMMALDRPVLVNMAVSRDENVFPMIPGGAAHNEIVLGPNQTADMDDDNMMMA
ncbi:MAG: biosynthetic-type acetolactate synthase large subunit [Proteobacteria bacterium]|nr:biosynthetic-type acetolactate synthase large subunit [Pseudomonadota bacterium]